MALSGEPRERRYFELVFQSDAEEFKCVPLMQAAGGPLAACIFIMSLKAMNQQAKLKERPLMEKRKTAIITGATGGLGKIITQVFLTRGWNVVATYRSDRSIERLRKELQPGIQQLLAVRADVTDASQVSEVFDKLLEKFERADALINTVGGICRSALTQDIEESDWDFMMNVNLKSTFLCSREFLRRHPKDGSYGRIISIAAMPALKPTGGRAAYAVSKAGVITFTQVLADELRGSGITANAIAPSIIRTDANIASMPDEYHSKWVSPYDIADAILFLCSDAASSVNGVVIPMFGGVN